MAQMLRVPALIPARSARQPQQSSATCPAATALPQARPSPKRQLLPGSAASGLSPSPDHVFGLGKLSIGYKKRRRRTKNRVSSLGHPMICAAAGSKVSVNLQILVMCCTCFPLWSKESCQGSTSVPGGLQPSPECLPRFPDV